MIEYYYVCRDHGEFLNYHKFTEISKTGIFCLDCYIDMPTCALIRHYTLITNKVRVEWK